MQTLKVIFIILEVLVLFNLLIFVHELGHYLAARWRKLKIERFAIWFGRPIWKKKINGVDFCMGWIPAGGYVALPQMAPMEAIEGKGDEPKESLPPISALDKIIVAFAGPLFSFGLALVFAVVVWMVGRPVSESEATTTIGYVEENSPAEAAGLKPGDRVISVNDEPVTRFGGMGSSIMWNIIRSETPEVTIKVDRNGEILSFAPERVVEPKTMWHQRKNLPRIGIYPREAAVIDAVSPNSPAEAAGLQSGDVVVEVAGTPMLHPAQLNDYIEAHPNEMVPLKIRRGENFIEKSIKPEVPLNAAIPNLKKGDVLVEISGQKLTDRAQINSHMEQFPDKPIEFTVLREGKTIQLSVSPKEIVKMTEKLPGVGNPKLGISWHPEPSQSIVKPNPWEQIYSSVDSMIGTFSALFSSKSEVSVQHMGGAVKILSIYYRLFESDHGWRLALWFSVLINVNLAILNMLPIPVLDGGHIVLAVVEGVRRKPINVRLLEMLQTACALLIIGFMLYITFFDVQDIKPPWKRSGSPAPQFSPKGNTQSSALP